MWKIIPYHEDDDTDPALVFLGRLEKKVLTGFDWAIEELSKRSIQDGQHLADYLGEQLWVHRESRCPCQLVFSYVSDWRLILLHGFHEKDGRGRFLSEDQIRDEIHIASRRLDSFRRRRR